MQGEPELFGNPLLKDMTGLQLPDAVSFWPLAPGWYWLAGLLLVSTALLLLCRYLTWRQNSYRRNSRAQLQQLSSPQAQQLPSQLRRVLQLSCAQPEPLCRRINNFLRRRKTTVIDRELWLESNFSFLNKTSAMLFSDEQLQQLQYLAYRPLDHSLLSDNEFNSLCQLSVRWISEHNLRGAKKS